MGPFGSPLSIAVSIESQAPSEVLGNMVTTDQKAIYILRWLWV